MSPGLNLSYSESNSLHQKKKKKKSEVKLKLGEIAEISITLEDLEDEGLFPTYFLSIPLFDPRISHVDLGRWWETNTNLTK